MNADEQAICTYLRSCPGQFVSGREIALRACGKRRFRQEPNWAVPVLERLLEQQRIECDTSGRYRLRGVETKRKERKWIAPHIRQILERSGKDFGEIIELEDNEDNADDRPN